VTSFVAVGFAIINSLSLQEKMARMLGNYLTSSTGVTVVFESAIVPKWGFAGGGSSIVFKNVYISRGGNGEADSLVLLPPVKDEDLEEDAIVSEISKWTHFHLSIDTVEVSLDMSRWLDGKGLVKDANVTGVRGVVGKLPYSFSRQERF
jgi:distribution and morphology protein 31